MLCNYGCGEESKFHFKNGKHCCAPHPRQCAFVCIKAIEERRKKGSWHSDITKSKIKNTLNTIDKLSWNKGLTKFSDERVAAYGKKQLNKIVSKETGRKISEAKTGKPRNGPPTKLFGDKNGMFGRTHSDEVKSFLSKRVKEKWSGEKNPWYGKSRTGENSPRWVSNEIKRKYKDYLNRVAWLTNKTYEEHIKDINPNNLKRELAGTKNGYQLDHIIPIKQGFILNISPELISSKENLQIISWEENHKKQHNIIQAAKILLEQWENAGLMDRCGPDCD